MKLTLNSIVFKLLGTIVVLLTISFAVVIATTGNSMKKVAWSGIETGSSESANRVAAEIQSYIERYSGIVVALANSNDVINFAAKTQERSAADYQGQSEYMEYLSTVKTVADKDKNIYNLYFASEKSQTFFDIHESELKPDFRCDNRSWYVEGKNEDKLYVTKAYIDGVTGKPVVSISAPVYQGSTYLGLFVMDLSLEMVNQIVTSLDIYQGAYAFLLDKDGTFLVHPEDSLIMSAKILDSDLKSIGEEMIAGKVGFAVSTVKGEQYDIFYNPIKLAGWSVGVSIPEQILTKPINQEINTTLFISIIVVLVLVFFVWYILRRSLIPLITLNKFTEEVSRGNLVAIAEVKTSDETGQLTENFNKMVVKIRDIINTMADLSVQLASHSHELAASSQEVNAVVEEVASTTNEVAAISKQGVESAEAAEKESKQVWQVAEEGNQAVRKTVEKINSIETSSQNTFYAIQKLSQQSNKIGEIIESITTIADQTNLLALNAAIEAARAGEQGRGFAVVAEEVRRLAEQSGEAAKEISSLIKETQVGVREATDAIERGSQEVSEGVQIANDASLSLEQMIKVVQINTDIIHSVAEGSKKANEGTQQLAESNEQIATNVQQVTISAQQLARIAEELQETVAQFKVN
ncbi:methyl-accepting chemotaxis protein [Desulforamulus aeronauticus]|uniref:Methyl-accepting chemotaxis sensory transducer with Cache sensor n=1 Tax=Desulforamulus aeronauticus DSM 10349 TaxID=1121421 RepID=A0A1M6SHV2_9FIRM|nr:methyl-accepting chemotaxis protein [Desulforamulus aeronauticus]SHK44342.1 methyl-accepting chemotaxis sensory transducer with Cache sensor [Desulforamulus aeronauticus DSM 10349]